MRQIFRVIALVGISRVASSAPATPTYESNVLPILTSKCVACHGAASPQAGLDLRTAVGVLRGGKSGAAVVRGSSERSLLISKVASRAMPPGDTKLDDAEIATIRAWIDAGAPGMADAPVTEHDALPVFQMRCVACHGKRKQEGGLDLRTRASRLKGGKSGPAFVPGKPEESLLIRRIAAGEMPPPKLFSEAFVRPPTETEVATLKRWIGSGALPAPEGHPVEAAFSDKETAHWSFRPPSRPALPRVAATARVRTAIDAFVLEKLEAKGMTLSPDAELGTLARRAWLAVTGLPPSPGELAAYLADPDPKSYERLVDRLLASPRFGERWAQFWLNAAGYADSEGIIDEDLIRPNAWRYRDYVIRSFNSGKPYKEFLTEQLASDELVDYKNEKPVTPALIDKLAATGFLRMVPDGTYSPANGSVAERMNVIADEIEVLSSSVMGLTIGCARCHNHKYDPIAQRDYYRLAAVLQTAYDPYDWLKPTERNLDVALEAERGEVAAFNAPLETEVKRLREALDAKPAPEKPERERLSKALADAKKKLRPIPSVRALYDMGGDPSPAFLLRRGEAQSIGDRVEPGVPGVLEKTTGMLRAVPPREGTSGNRLALARWLTQPRHPLTARVVVNRIWMQYFGRGIVASVSNFGRNGLPPSHPELLDWLAVELEDSGWNLKHLHRLILISSVFRQSSRSGAADPENILLSRMPLRRMDAEQIHDSILRVAGRLDLTAFGPPVPVEIKPGGEVSAQGGKDGWRRAIYVMQRRTTPPTMLDVFDLPAMTPNCIERGYSTVSTQALQLTNSAAVLEHAKFFAGRLIDEFGEDRNRQIENAYLRTRSRKPTAAETAGALESLAALEKQWDTHLRERMGVEPIAQTARWRALASFCHALLSSAEFSYID